MRIPHTDTRAGQHRHSTYSASDFGAARSNGVTSAPLAAFKHGLVPLFGPGPGAGAGAGAESGVGAGLKFGVGADVGGSAGSGTGSGTGTGTGTGSGSRAGKRSRAALSGAEPATKPNGATNGPLRLEWCGVEWAGSAGSGGGGGIGLMGGAGGGLGVLAVTARVRHSGRGAPARSVSLLVAHERTFLACSGAGSGAISGKRGWAGVGGWLGVKVAW